MLKRSTSDVSSPPSDDIDRKPTLPTEEPKVKKAKNGHPCKTTSSRLGTSNGTSNKAILGKMIVEAGLKALSRADAQVAVSGRFPLRLVIIVL